MIWGDDKKKVCVPPRGIGVVEQVFVMSEVDLRRDYATGGLRSGGGSVSESVVLLSFFRLFFSFEGHFVL